MSQKSSQIRCEQYLFTWWLSGVTDYISASVSDEISTFSKLEGLGMSSLKNVLAT